MLILKYLKQIEIYLLDDTQYQRRLRVVEGVDTAIGVPSEEFDCKPTLELTSKGHEIFSHLFLVILTAWFCSAIRLKTTH